MQRIYLRIYFIVTCCVMVVLCSKLLFVHRDQFVYYSVTINSYIIIYLDHNISLYVLFIYLYIRWLVICNWVLQRISPLRSRVILQLSFAAYIIRMFTSFVREQSGFSPVVRVDSFEAVSHAVSHKKTYVFRDQAFCRWSIYSSLWIL